MPYQSDPNVPRPNSIGGFALPRSTSGLHRVLVRGRGVSVYYDLQPPNVWPEHSHEHVQIVIAIDDVDAVLSWELNGASERRGVAGQFVWLLPSGVTHAKSWLGMGGMVVLYAEPAFVREICAGEVQVALVEDYSALARFDLLVGRLTAEFRALCRSGLPATPAIIESAGTLLATHILRYFIPLEKPHRLSPERLRAVLDYVDHHIGENISRADLARMAGMSIRTFGDCFKERTGLTPFNYIMQRRTVRAMEMVDTGLLTKTAIAADLGFSDQSHMMRRIEAMVAGERSIPARPARGEEEKK